LHPDFVDGEEFSKVIALESHRQGKPGAPSNLPKTTTLRHATQTQSVIAGIWLYESRREIFHCFVVEVAQVALCLGA
jgi:hypothetical protein